jgi:hypothetical protein
VDDNRRPRQLVRGKPPDSGRDRLPASGIADEKQYCLGHSYAFRLDNGAGATPFENARKIADASHYRRFAGREIGVDFGGPAGTTRDGVRERGGAASRERS